MGESGGKAGPEQVGDMAGSARQRKRHAALWRLMAMYRIRDCFGEIEKATVWRKALGSRNHSRVQQVAKARRKAAWIASLERDADERARRDSEARGGVHRVLGHASSRLPEVRRAAVLQALREMEPGRWYGLAEIRARWGVTPLEVTGFGRRTGRRLWFEQEGGKVRLSAAGLEARADMAALE